MRYRWLLSWALVATTLPAAAFAQRANEAGTTEEVAVAENAAGEPNEVPAVVRLDVWQVTLTGDVEDQVVEEAQAPLADREATIARLRRLEQSGAVRRSSHLMATTLANQPLRVHLGSREPRVRGINTTRTGITRAVQMEEIGTLLQATPRLADESRVIVELRLESSHLDESDVAMYEPDEGDPTNATRVVQSTYQATIACPSGGAVVAMGAGAEQSTTLIYLAAEVVE